MNKRLLIEKILARWSGFLLLAVLLLAGPARAQSTDPTGGTLSPATSTECAGFNSGTLTLSGFTGTVLRYQLDNGNGFVDIAGSGGSSTYTYSNLQVTTRFRAIVQNGSNPAVASTVATVTVNNPPTATINSQGPTRFCQQGTIFLVAGPSGNFTYQFLRNGINIAGATSQTFSTLVTSSASYSVRVTDAAGCSSISSSIQVQVQPQNVVSLGTTMPTTFCQGGSALLTANVTGTGAANYTYQFTRDGVEIPGATSSTFSATTSGSYRVVVNNPATCSATSNAVSITVNPVPVVAIDYPAATYCQTGPANPTPTVSPGGGTFSATPTGLVLNANTGTINLSQSQPGTYAVRYSVGGTCPASASTPVTITAPPTAAFSYGAGNRCAGTAGTLTPTLVPDATAGTFSATPAGLSLNASTGAVDVAQSQPGTYTVTNSLAAANGCAATSASTTLTLNVQPTATLAAGGATTFCRGGSVTLTASGGAAGATFQFLNNGQPIGGATASTFTATADGIYTVAITNVGGCTATSAPIAVTVNPQTTAAFSYAGSAFCQSSGAATPTITGTAGGTFASTAGLSLDAATGAITPGTSTAGTYTVTYSVGGPCPSSATQSVTITAPAAAGFSYGPASAFCTNGANATVALASGATAGTFTSTTGLSINATTGAITLSTSTPGTYTVTNTVAASGGCPAATASTTVTITAQPTATLAAGGSTTFCQGGGVTLTASGGAAGATYQFLNNGQPISGATGSTFTATASGSYSVVVTNAGLCAATSAAIAVTVNPTATPTLSYPAATLCQNTTSAPATVSIPGGTFASTAGLVLNASTGAINPAQSQPGTYTVTYTAGSPCPGSTTATVTISAVPSALFAYSGGSTFCPTSTTNPTPTISGAMGGTFSAPSGLVIDPATGTINLQTSTAGSYAVTYSVGGPCPASSTLNITITSAPVATFAFPSGSNCGGTTGTVLPTFTGSGSAGIFSSTTGLSLNATTGAVNLAASTPGTYTVTNTIPASGACSAVSATASITINAVPTATLTASGPTTFCQGGSVTLTATGGAAGATFQFLNNGQPISGATSSTFVASAAGSYSVVVTNTSGCSGTSAATTLTVNAAPAQPTLTANGALLTAAGTAGATYQYFLNGTAIAGATGATYTATQNGSYTVVATSSAGCASVPSAPLNVMLSGSRAAHAPFELAVYPNPTTDGRLTLTLSGVRATASYSVINALGQTVLTGTFAAAPSHELNLGQLATGVYTLRVTTADGTAMRRVIRR